MISKKAIAYLLLLFGEALIVIAFLYFERNFPSSILTLNIVVSSIIFLLYFSGFVVPRLDFNDKSQKAIGSLGIRGFFILFYSISAIVLMTAFNMDETTAFRTQLIFQMVLLFILGVGMYFGLAASEKTQEVYNTETGRKANLEAIKRAVNDVQFKLKALEDAPNDVLQRVTAFQESLRFVSPATGEQAVSLEQDLLSEVNKLDNNIGQNSIDHDKIIAIINRCDMIYQQRKQLYSNN